MIDCAVWERGAICDSPTPTPIPNGNRKLSWGMSQVETLLKHKLAANPVEAVRLPPEDSLRNEVAYAIGALSNARHAKAAAQYLAFLATPAAHAAYSKYGFVNATPQELALKPIP